MLLLGQKVLGYLVQQNWEIQARGDHGQNKDWKRKNRRTAASTVFSRKDTAGISAKGDAGDELQV